MRVLKSYQYRFSSFCCLISLTSSSAPDTNISGKFSQGPANSLRSDASEALEDFRDDARLEQPVPRRLTWKNNYRQNYVNNSLKSRYFRSTFSLPEDGGSLKQTA